jgi:hypothetical protein
MHISRRRAGRGALAANPLLTRRQYVCSTRKTVVEAFSVVGVHKQVRPSDEIQTGDVVTGDQL